MGNKTFLIVLFLSCFVSFISCTHDKTLSEILREDTVEVYSVLNKILNSNDNYIWIGIARYEEGQKPQSFELIHRQKGSQPIILTGTLNYWDDVKIEKNVGYSTFLSNTDTLNMIKDFSEILMSCKKIADGNDVILLNARNRLADSNHFSNVPFYVEMILYYHGEHFLLIYTEDNYLMEILEYEKEKFYPDLDYLTKCSKVMENVYLIGFSSQYKFFKEH